IANTTPASCLGRGAACGPTKPFSLLVFPGIALGPQRARLGAPDKDHAAGPPNVMGLSYSFSIAIT
ncbi:MAG: hypothetical protein QMA93_02670, partial [Acidimicrobiales bacterium]